MANRYWVGGAGTWNTSSTANWSTSSGGPSGASVPTAADSVFFDQAGTYAVTCTGALTCLDFTVSAGTVTIANGTAPSFAISGSLFLASGTIWSATGTITMNATTTGNTITTNGVTLSGTLTLSGAGGGWALGSNLSVAGGRIFQINQGAFDTANFAVSCGAFLSNGSSTRSVTLGSSTVTTGIGTSGAVVNFEATGLTFNAGTSLLTSNIATATFALGGLAWYDVSFTRTTASSSLTILGANTFRNLSFSGVTTAGVCTVTFDSNQTITGTLTVGAGTTAACRTFLRSSAVGTQRTLNCAGVAAIADVDFRDIAFAGGVSLPLTGTRLGDCKGNSNVTFDASKTVYCATAASANWGTSGAGIWSATSGGVADATMFPLAQDVAVITATTPSSGSTITFNAQYNIGTLDMSARTAATLIINNTAVVSFYGDYISATGVSLSASPDRLFTGRVLQKITSAGVASASGITVNSPGGTVQLQDALTITGVGYATLLWGTLELQSYTLTAGNVDAQSGSGVRTLATGTGRIVCTGSFFTGASSLTVTGTATVSMTSSSPKSFGVPVVTTLTLDQGGAGALTIFGGGTYANITNSYSSTGPTTVIFGSSTTSTFTDFNLTGSPGAVCTVAATSPPVRATIKKTGFWYVGANSTDGGNNTGLLFTAGGGIDYLSFSNIAATRFPTTVSSLVAEAAIANDALAVRGTYGVPVLEIATATDVDFGRLAAFALVAETATGTDSGSSRFIPSALVVEAGAVTETYTGRPAYNAQFADGLIAESGPSGVAGAYNGTLNESVQAIASLLPSRIFSALAAEAVTVTDAMTARNLWTLIDDTEDPNWQNINSP